MLVPSAPFELSHLEHSDVGVQLPQEPPHPECVVFSPSIVAHVHVEVDKAKLARGNEGEEGGRGEVRLECICHIQKRFLSHTNMNVKQTS